MSGCIFCKIVSGELPAQKVYEDDDTLAFLDIAPVNPGHCLVITKKHFANLEEIPEDYLAKLALSVKKTGKALKKGIGCEGYNVQENNDPLAGQVVPHIHFHVIPRLKGDGHKLWPQQEYKPGEAEELAAKLKKSF